MYHEHTPVWNTHTLCTHTRAVVIPVFPLPALLHMHEAQAMCEAAHCQPGLNGQGRGRRESCCISVCASLSPSTLYLSDWATASHTHTHTQTHSNTNWEDKQMHMLTHTHAHKWASTHSAQIHRHKSVHTYTKTHFYLMFWAMMMTGIKIEEHIRGTGDNVMCQTPKA